MPKLLKLFDSDPNSVSCFGHRVRSLAISLCKRDHGERGSANDQAKSPPESRSLAAHTTHRPTNTSQVAAEPIKAGRPWRFSLRCHGLLRRGRVDFIDSADYEGEIQFCHQAFALLMLVLDPVRLTIPEHQTIDRELIYLRRRPVKKPGEIGTQLAPVSGEMPKKSVTASMSALKILCADGLHR